MTASLTSLGWDRFPARCPDGHEPGRVARADRGVSTVLTASGALRVSMGGLALAAVASDPVALPCAGDWVALRRWPDERVTIEVVLPRRNAVVRRTAGKDSSGQVLAANLDVAAVVASLDPMPELATIERLLTLAWDSGARPYLILTKADLVADPCAVAAQLEEIAPEVPTVAVSAAVGAGIEGLKALAATGQTLGLIGASGSGKSTLVNALAGREVMPTQEIRRVDGKGRHTTTHRALVPITGGGAVLDTPGLRSVGLLDGGHGLGKTFQDVGALAAECRYPQCSHSGEPGCAIALALATGDLSYRRWSSWLKLVHEAEFEGRRRSARINGRARRTRRAGPRPGRV